MLAWGAGAGEFWERFRIDRGLDVCVRGGESCICFVPSLFPFTFGLISVRDLLFLAFTNAWFVHGIPMSLDHCTSLQSS